jgi:hypothetical protein
VILYLYALADRLPSIDDIAGVGGEPLVTVEGSGARLIGGWLPEVPAAERATLEAQDRLIRTLHDRADALLPMRFGTAVADVARAVDAVDVIGAGLAERFALVRGREQMTIRVVRRDAATAPAPSPVPSAQQTGTEYLRARSRKDAPPELAPLLDATGSLMRARRVERGRHEDAVATVYELIDRGTSVAYRTLAGEAARRVPELSVHVTGPSPPYAFAQG